MGGCLSNPTVSSKKGPLAAGRRAGGSGPATFADGADFSYERPKMGKKPALRQDIHTSLTAYQTSSAISSDVGALALVPASRLELVASSQVKTPSAPQMQALFMQHHSLVPTQRQDASHVVVGQNGATVTTSSLETGGSSSTAMSSSVQRIGATEFRVNVKTTHNVVRIVRTTAAFAGETRAATYATSHVAYGRHDWASDSGGGGAGQYALTGGHAASSGSFASGAGHYALDAGQAEALPPGSLMRSFSRSLADALPVVQPRFPAYEDHDVGRKPPLLLLTAGEASSRRVAAAASPRLPDVDAEAAAAPTPRSPGRPVGERNGTQSTSATPLYGEAEAPLARSRSAYRAREAGSSRELAALPSVGSFRNAAALPSAGSFRHAAALPSAASSRHAALPSADRSRHAELPSTGSSRHAGVPAAEALHETAVKPAGSATAAAAAPGDASDDFDGYEAVGHQYYDDHDGLDSEAWGAAAENEFAGGSGAAADLDAAGHHDFDAADDDGDYLDYDEPIEEARRPAAAARPVPGPAVGQTKKVKPGIAQQRPHPAAAGWAVGTGAVAVDQVKRESVVLRSAPVRRASLKAMQAHKAEQGTAGGEAFVAVVGRERQYVPSGAAAGAAGMPSPAARGR